jgi:hypothetical protein
VYKSVQLKFGILAEASTQSVYRLMRLILDTKGDT